MTLTTLGCGTRPVSIGSRRWPAECSNILESFLFPLMLHLRPSRAGWKGGGGEGRNCVAWTYTEATPNITGHYVSRQCQLVSLEDCACKWENKTDYSQAVTDRNEFGTAGWGFSDIFIIYLLPCLNLKLCSDKWGRQGESCDLFGCSGHLQPALEYKTSFTRVGTLIVATLV